MAKQSNFKESQGTIYMETVRVLGSEDFHCLSLRLQFQSKSRTPIYKEALIAQPASALRHAKHQ